MALGLNFEVSIFRAACSPCSLLASGVGGKINAGHAPRCAVKDGVYAYAKLHRRF